MAVFVVVKATECSFSFAWQMAGCLRNIRLEGLLVVIEVRGYFVVVDVFDALGYSLRILPL